jgi:hypothetical protein
MFSENKTETRGRNVLFDLIRDVHHGACFSWDFPAINDRRYQATQVSMTTRIRVINEGLIANNKNKKTKSQERES